MSAQTETIKAFQREQLREAIERFDLEIAPDMIPGWAMVGEASVGNGTRITVAVSPLTPRAALFLGGNMLVTVISPWTRAYALQDGGMLHWNYIEEKFGPPWASVKRVVNWADMYGVARTIAEMMGRPLEGVPGTEDE